MKAIWQAVDGWQALAGIGLFLFAMLLLERALDDLSGVRLSRFLRQRTQTRLGALGTGALVTAILQSSSLVGVMTLALVGAGVLPLVNGIGVVLGANLGTTVTGWLVTLLGFKLDLDRAALPLLALASLGYFIMRSWPRPAALLRLAIALGLLLFALGLMKAAVAPPADMMAAVLTGRPHLLWYFAGGLVLTAVIQSSSAMMMVMLSLLAAGVVDLTAAAAVVIGADLGTTSTVMLGSAGGSADRRRVAWAHFGYNLVVDLLALVVALPMLPKAVQLLGIGDPLWALVGFHSAINFFGLLLFYPLLGAYTALLTRRVRDRHRSLALYLDPNALALAETALAALARESERLFWLCAARFARPFHLQFTPVAGDEAPPASRVGYQQIKDLEQELIEYAARIQALPLQPEQALKINHDLVLARNAVLAVKALRDVAHHLTALEESADDRHLALYAAYREAVETLAAAARAVRGEEGESRMLRYREAAEKLNAFHDRMHQTLVQKPPPASRPELRLSSLLNLNREVWLGAVNLWRALGQLCFSPSEFAALDRAPAGPEAQSV